MEPAPPVEVGFFPLDEELALEAGQLTPRLHDWLVRLGVWMPFGQATRLLAAFSGVSVGKESARRLTEAAGVAYEAVQEQEARRLSDPGAAVSPQKVVASKREVISSDGAMVPVLKREGGWAEVKTLVIAQQQRDQLQRMQTTKLSYFSRLADAENFADLALVETRRRGLEQAEEVAAVMDGALWLQGLVDLHCPQAVRILDFPHAAQRISEIAEVVQVAGTKLADDWVKTQLHRLKHEGPRRLLRVLRALRKKHPDLKVVVENVAYLEKRQAHLQYPRYQADEWPIGSGMVESANKQVMQARLKGPGMHWARKNVNPMLALRTAVCNDRWEEAWHEVQAHMHQQQTNARLLRTQRRIATAWWPVLSTLARLGAFSPPVPATPPVVSKPTKTSSASTDSKLLGRPAANHPWRRPFLPRRRAG